MFTMNSRAILLVALAASAIGFTGIWYWLRARSMRAYLQRPSNIRIWQERFPHASEDCIRTFLRLVAQSFSIPVEHDLKFRPEDSIMAIYQASNPQAGTPDALELESLIISLRRHYHFDLAQPWNPSLSVGDLFALVQAPNA